MDSVIYFNRAFLPERDVAISVRSRALNYGLGCFAGIRGYKTDDGSQVNVFRLDRHVRRLDQSARIIRLKLADTPDKIDYQALQQIAKTVSAVGWQLANQDGRPKLNTNLPEQLTKDMKTAQTEGWGKLTPVIPPLPGEPQ